MKINHPQKEIPLKLLLKTHKHIHCLHSLMITIQFETEAENKQMQFPGELESTLPHEKLKNFLEKMNGMKTNKCPPSLTRPI